MIKTRCLNKLFVEKLYGFCLSIAYIARRRHPYIEFTKHIAIAIHERASRSEYLLENISLPSPFKDVVMYMHYIFMYNVYMYACLLNE